jgi:hypothetical protein
MPWVVPVVAVVGAAVSAYGAIKQGQAASAAAEYNAKVSQESAKIALSEADLQAQQIDRTTRQRLGALRANAGASGGTGAGSALDVIGDVAEQSSLEKQYALYQGELKARGFTNTANVELAQGADARSASIYAASSRLLEGGTNAASIYSRTRAGSSLTREG